MGEDGTIGPVVIHSGGMIAYANDAVRSLLGTDSSRSLVGTPIEELVAPPSRQALYSQFDQVLSGDAPVTGLRVALGTDDRTEVIAVTSRIEWENEQQLQTSFIGLSPPSFEWASPGENQLMDEAPIGVTVADVSQEDDPLVFVNDEFLKLTGYDREEVVGRNCRFLQGPETQEEPVRKLREAIDTQQPVTVELRNYRKDGSLFWNRVSISPVENQSGEVTHFVGFQENISDAKIFEREKTLFEKHAEASDQMMIITDDRGVVEYVNPEFERMTGYSSQEIAGQTLSVIESQEPSNPDSEAFWNTLEVGDILEEETANLTKSGERYTVKRTVVPITDDRNEITNYTVIDRNVTEKQLTKQVLDVLNRVLRHNVRTSINVIEGYAELLSENPDNVDLQNAAEVIHDRTTALKEISERTTTIRELIRGHKKPTPLKLSGIRNIVDRCRVAHPDADITVAMDTEENRVVENGTLLQLALEEAIENAVIHNDQPQPVVEISVRQRQEDDRATVRIADTGPGIPKSELNIIREGHETPLLHTRGLGLWMLYWSVTALGGTVDFTTNEPTGSVINLEIPLSVASEEFTVNS